MNFIGECSGFAKFPGSNAVEPPPMSDLEVLPENPNHLHRLVSEGDVGGLRLVHFISDMLLALFFEKP